MAAGSDGQKIVTRLQYIEILLGRLKTRERTTRDQVAGVDNARTFGIDHSDKFRSHFASVLVYCYLIFFYVGTYCFVRLPVNNGFIDKVQQQSMQSQFHYKICKVNT